MSSAVARALQITGLLLYFWGSGEFLVGLQRMQVGLGFRCYSKKVSLGRKVFAREEFRFKCLLSLLGFSPVHPPPPLPPSHPLTLPPQLNSDTERSWHIPAKGDLLRQAVQVRQADPKREYRLRCGRWPTSFQCPAEPLIASPPSHIEWEEPESGSVTVGHGGGGTDLTLEGGEGLDLGAEGVKTALEERGPWRYGKLRI